MEIRRAEEADMPRIEELLRQVNLVHHKGRPDLFKYGARKYTDEELRVLIHDDSRPIFVALDGAGTVQGYAFCIFQQYVNHNIMTDIKTLCIDDLCVDEACRGQHIGTALYRAKITLETPDLFAWTAVIVTVSVIFERLFLRLVDAAVRKAGS